MTDLPEAARALVRAHLQVAEGLRLTPYRDTQGYLTIGYGHNLDAKGISRSIAERLLEDDLAEAIGEVRRFLPWALALDPVRAAAVVELMFNLGPAKLLRFRRTLAALKAGRCTEAAQHLLDSHPWVDQVGPTRSGRLARMLATGEAGPEGRAV